MRAIEQLYTTYIDILFQQNNYYDPLEWWGAWIWNIAEVFWQVSRNYFRNHVQKWLQGKRGKLMIITAVIMIPLTLAIGFVFFGVMAFYVSYIAISVLAVNTISTLTIAFAEAINSTWLTVLCTSYRFWEVDDNDDEQWCKDARLESLDDSQPQPQPIGEVTRINSYLTILEGTLSNEQRTKICLLGGAVVQTDKTSFIFGITTKNVYESLTDKGTTVNVCYKYEVKTVCHAIRVLVRCKVDNGWSVEDVQRISVLRDVSLRGSVSKNGVFNDYIRHLSLLTEDIIISLVTYCIARLPSMPNELHENSFTIALGMCAFRHLVMSGDLRMALTRPLSEVLTLWGGEDLAHLALLAAKTFNTRVISFQNSWAPLVHQYCTNDGIEAPIKMEILAKLMNYHFIDGKIIDAEGMDRGRLDASSYRLVEAAYKPGMF